MLQIFEIIVILLSIVMIVNSIRQIFKNNRTIYLVHLFFCIIFVFPLVLDYIVGYPVYTAIFKGFIISYDDSPTRFLYASYILVSQLIMLGIGTELYKKFKIDKIFKHIRKKDIKENYEIVSIHNEEYNKYIDLVLLFASIITIALVLVFPVSKFILWDFGWRDARIIIEGQKYYSTIERFSYISIAAAIAFLFYKKRSIWVNCIFVVLIYMSTCVEAKRSILLFIAIILISYWYFSTKIKNQKWVYLLGIILFTLFAFYSFHVINIRGSSIDDFKKIYTTLRIEYFRDDTVKMAIYSLLNPKKIQILNYTGQSLITQIGSLFPLSFAGVSVIGYNSFLTSALMGIPFDSSVKWMTTSIFDEMLANFGFFGFWIAPTICGILALVADKQNKKLAPITITALVLLFMYSPNYIMWFLQFCFLIIIIEIIVMYFRKKKEITHT